MDSSLNAEWVLYFHAKNKDKLYADNTTLLMKIDTIKLFWQTLNNIPKPLAMFSDGVTKKIIGRTGETPNALSFFRSNSYPSWEHKSNINGFEWSFRKFKDVRDINILWINLLIFIISEENEHSDSINGARIVDCTIDNKVMYRIEIWLNNKDLKDYFEIKLKEVLNVNTYTKLLYRDHSVVKES